MSNKKTFSLVAIFVGAFLFLSSLFSVHEGSRAILLRLGKMVRDNADQVIVYQPGLHFKIPFINTVRFLDVRLQTLDIESSRIVTAEKKDVLVDYYAKWRIENAPLYFTRTGGNELRAENLLRQKLNDGLRAEFGKRDISEVVSGERVDIMRLLKDQANASAKDLGITVIDVRIKRIDLPDEVSAAVFDRMRAERERIATEHRAKGKSEAEFIRAKADADVTVKIATAQSESKKVRGQGDAIAAKIYADAYSKDSSFYAFYRSLSAYKQSFHSKKDFLLLRPDSQFFKYFNTAGKKA